ncbi:uncharacterized protein LOC105441750 [Strongylocentrotus purpuratus]|uniref:G-protein coupled receptors family 1 profile domain-containing protein n=1 Tax=Strongylocentrotus purpuratus TaxID=7668 RepID=A0A7M7HLQ7_STRPU|nr:uncharacterized protein LOC105441750 [Strongylocentrotus purpuratus]|eukprot:XP_011671475.1 PREDICTED: uncharacterized protein LOC105441750 [Strongylocentrotus purpuratus]
MENTTTIDSESGLGFDNGTNITAVAIFIIIAILIFVSNILVLVVLHKGRYLFDEVMVLLLQILAYSDLIGGMIASLLTASIQLLEVTPASRNICRMTPMVTTFMVMQSLYIVGLVNFFRYLSITRPLFYLRSMTVSRVRVSAVTLKIYVLLNTCVLLPVQGFPFKESFDGMCGPDRLDVLHHNRPSEDVSHGNITALVFVGSSFLLPLCLLTFVNARLLWVACRISRRKKDQHRAAHGNLKSSVSNSKGYSGSGHQEEDHRQIRKRHHRKGLKGFLTVFLMTGSFYMSCIPFAILTALSVVKPDLQFVYGYGWMVALMLMMSNSWWNGPIYLLTCRTFRKKALEILTCRSSRRESSFQENEQTHVPQLVKQRPQASSIESK